MFAQQVHAENLFLKDVSALHSRARDLLQSGPESPETSIALLQTALAAEIICVMRYTMIAVSPDGLKNGWIGAEFFEQANDERKHMALAAGRIEQLGGVPDYGQVPPAPRIASLNGNHGNFVRCLADNLAAEQCVIAHYRDLIRYFGPRDPQTCAILQDIIRDEEDHTGDMTDLLGSYLG